MGQTLSLWWNDLERQDQYPCPHTIYSDGFKLLVQCLLTHTLDYEYAPDVVGILAERFGIDIRPLEKIFDPNEDEYPADWNAKAQLPDELADCLQSLIRVLDSNPESLTEKDLVPRKGSVGPQRQQRDREYFLRGEFRRDLGELLILADWAKENGESRVRLYLN